MHGKVVKMVKGKGEIQIAYLGGGWTTNIGNAFIDLGSIQSLKMAAPKSTVHFVSEFPRWLFGIQSRSAKKRLFIRFARKLPEWMREIPGIKDSIPKKVSENVRYCFDLMSAIKSDYAVVSGVMLCEEFIELFGPIFLKLKEDKVKIIINGGGGANYSDKEISEVRKFLERINPYAFISRDKQSFKNYQDLAEHSLNGIDCAFFTNNYFTPAKLKLPKYVILNFDYHPEPKLNIQDRLIIRTHHSCWGGISKRYLGKNNLFISGTPDGYLNLYANTEALYSDRVHACVATLAFGHPCRLYYAEIPRASLLDRVGATTIRHKLTYPDTEKIEKEKKKQVRFLSYILTS